MKIVHLSNTPLSNAPANLAKIQRDAGHESVALLAKQSNTNKVFVGGQLWSSMDPWLLMETVREADIVHFHNFAFEQEIFKAHAAMVDLVRKKRCLIQYHSPRHSIQDFEHTINDPFFKGRRAVVAQYQVRQYPEAEHIVPNVLPIYDTLFTPIKDKPLHPFLVSYAPSNTTLKDWDDKGYRHIMPVLQELHRFGVTCEIITNTPYQETMVKKKWAHVGVEEIVTGSYHLSFLEYMAFGCATIGNLDELTREAMKKIVGEEGMFELPYIQATTATLGNRLVSLARDPEVTHGVGLRSRQWIEKYWSPEKHVKHFERIYESI